MSGAVEPAGEESGVQRKWDELCCKSVAEGLRVGADERTRARLLASCAPGSGVWMNAIPSAPLGLNLDNNSLRIAIGLRLGVPLVMPHQCQCGAAVDKLGHHGLACKRSAGRHLRHNLLNDGILRAAECRGAGRPRAIGPGPWLRKATRRSDAGPLGSRSLSAVGCDVPRHLGTFTCRELVDGGGVCGQGG